MKLVNNTKDKTILFIVHNYNSFQKDPIEETAKYFKKVYVLVRYKPISKIAKYLPFKRLKKYQEDYVIDRRKIPNNVEVIRTPVWYLPFGFLNRLLGEAHFKAVDQAIKKHQIKFDIVHCHFLWSSGYVGMKLKEKYKVPFVVTGHGYDVYKLPFQNEYWRNKISQVLSSADIILTVSNYNKEYLQKLEMDHNKIQVIYNGFREDIFYSRNKVAVRRELKIPLKVKVGVTVGNLERVKGQDLLVQAVNKLYIEGVSFLCYLVGGGSMHRNLEKMVKTFGIEKSVFVVGPRSHTDVAKWISAADIVIIPSLRESASVVLLEALACGVPVVAGNVGIVSEVIDSSDIGYIFKSGNTDSLAKYIKKSLFKNWNSTIISTKAQKYTWSITVKKIINIYKNKI